MTLQQLKQNAQAAASTPRSRFVRRSTVVALFVALPALPALQTPLPTDTGELWRMLAAAAIGALATAFIAGRNAVTRQDMVELERKLIKEVRDHSPWQTERGEVTHRIIELEKRMDHVLLRTDAALQAANAAVGLKDLVIQALQETRAGRDK